jgi:putative phage-type endonuclease
MQIIKDVEQGSEEWLQMRLGCITASKMADLMSNGRGSKPSKTAETYMMKLIAERLTGESEPFFENAAMKWGTETEDQARAMYELNEGVDVEEVAFIKRCDFIGISPDGLVGDTGMVEIKCPTSSTQIKRFFTEDYSSDYKAQIQAQLWVAEREYCDFLSFDPRIETDASYLLKKVYRDDEYIKSMEEKTAQFIETMQEMLTKLEG